jgi:hypothetical protein
MGKIIDEISNQFLDKINKGVFWENEYGMCNSKTSMNTHTHAHKCVYEKETDFKVQMKTLNGIDYFKIVPYFYAFPGGSYYWESVDGKIINGQITFYENRYK